MQTLQAIKKDFSDDPFVEITYKKNDFKGNKLKFSKLSENADNLITQMEECLSDAFQTLTHVASFNVRYNTNAELIFQFEALTSVGDVFLASKAKKPINLTYWSKRQIEMHDNLINIQSANFTKIIDLLYELDEEIGKIINQSSVSSKLNIVHSLAD